MGYQMVLQTFAYTLLPMSAAVATASLILLSLHQKTLMFFFVSALTSYGFIFALGTACTSAAARAASVAQIDARSVMTDSILNYETIK